MRMKFNFAGEMERNAIGVRSDLIIENSAIIFRQHK